MRFTAAVASLWAAAAGAAAASSATDNLCYSVQFAGPSGQQNFVLKPVTGFPASHTLVSKQNCGNRFAPGDPIPGGPQLWSNNGAAANTSRSCQTTTGSGLFYAYNNPDGASSNTGFEQDKAVVVYFVVDADGDLSVVLVFDRPGNGNSGRVEMNIDAPELKGKELTFDLRDDNHEPNCGNGHCRWDPATGKVSGMRWDWYSCCTDGMVLGNLPSSEGFQIPFNFDQLRGIDTFRMGSWNPETNDIEFEDLSAADVLTAGISVVVDTCGAYCSAKPSCGECSLDPECGWCEETQACMMADDAAECAAGEFNTGDECCAACVAAANFGECAFTAGCAWDHASAGCISVAGEPGTPEFRMCRETDYVQRPVSPVAPYAPCPGRVAGPDGATLAAWCSGNGQCDWLTKTCDCDSANSGYGGPACAIACPVGEDGAICGGNGVCGPNGACTCNCGHTGADCGEEHCLEQCGSDAPDLKDVCVIGDCATVCGVRLAGDACTGSEGPDDGACVCAEGWYGPDCTRPCPGVNEDGTGAVCGGAGECTAEGQCVCSGCNAVPAGGDGTCRPLPDATCSNYGASFCNATSQASECRCVGQWAGPSCDDCDCPTGVGCNAISGACEFTQCGDDEYQRTPGSLAADTECAPIADACNVAEEYEASPPTRTSDRVCLPLDVCTGDEFEAVANTPTSNRACAALTVCSNAAGTFERVAPTRVSDRGCGAVTACAADEYEAEAVTATSDRACAKLTTCVAGASYEQSAPTRTSDRVCTAYSLECSPGCDGTTAVAAGAGFELVAPTPTSDRVCGTVRGECAGDTVEAAAPTCTSDRVCVPVDDCAADPCQNGGECTDKELDYECACPPPYAGKDCAFFDSCSVPGVCANGGACTATADGAVCACAAGFFGACCADADAGGDSEEGDVCMDIDTAASQDGGGGEDEGSEAEAASMTVPIVGAVLGALVAFLIVGVAVRRQREARDTADLKEQLDKELAMAGGSLANPMFLASNPRAGEADYEAIRVMEDQYGYTEPGAAGRGRVGDATYAGGDGVDDVYAVGAAGADSENTYDSANAAAGGSDPVYGTATAGAEGDMYAVASPGGTGGAVPGLGGGADPTYSIGSASPGEGDMYAMASGDGGAEPTYGIATPEDGVADYALGTVGGAAEPVYDQGAAAADPTYGLATQEGENVYDTGSAEPVYGRADEENAYGLHPDAASAEGAYDLGSGAAENTYGLQPQESTGSNVYANGVEVAPGVVLSGTMARSLMQGERVYDNAAAGVAAEPEELEPEEKGEGPPPVDGYLETEPHHRMPPDARSGRRKSGAL